MLIDKHEVDNIFQKVPTLTIKMSPELAAIDAVLDDDDLFTMIRHDLQQRHPQTAGRGRHSTPVTVILRMLVVKHLYNWSYENTEEMVADSLVLRQFCRVYFHPVPDHTTLCRWATLIQPQTLVAFNERLLALAIAGKVTRGRKLRTDGTVVETNIRPPTDSGLLADSVRVLGRTLGRAKRVLGAPGSRAKETFRNRSRSARQLAREIAKRSKHGKERLRPLYERLVKTTRATIRQAQQVVRLLQQEAPQQGKQLIETLEMFTARAEQVVTQTVRRVFEGESVPAAEKLFSIFEPTTHIIRRGKAGKPNEFGHKVWLTEVEGGFLSQYDVLEGNPPDAGQWPPVLRRHVQQFGHPPWQASADRSVYSPTNERFAEKLGVQRVVLPKPGQKPPARQQHERQRWFWRGRRFHAGVEGRISVIKRKYGLGRCRNRGLVGFEQWVGWGVIANNLTIIGQKLST